MNILTKDSIQIGGRLLNTATITPSAVYNVSQVFERMHSTFMGESIGSGKEFRLDIVDSIAVAYWDIDALTHFVFSCLVSHSLLATHLGDQLSLKVSMPDLYSASISMSIHHSYPANHAQRAAFKDSISQLELEAINSCVAAHKGTLSFNLDGGNLFELELPLYKLCIQ